jgi:hypothetical protein
LGTALGGKLSPLPLRDKVVKRGTAISPPATRRWSAPSLVFRQWLLEHHAKGQAKLNSQVRMDSPVAMRRSGCRRPQSEGLFANPNRQITAPPQAFIVLGTVGHPTLLLRDLVATISVGFVRLRSQPMLRRASGRPWA